MDIKDIIQKIMYDKRLNQAEFAKAIDVSPSQVNEWLKGKNKPGYNKLRLICIKFGMDANMVLGLNEYEDKPTNE